MTDSAKVDLSAAASAIAEMVAAEPQGEVSNLADVYTTKKPRLNPDAIGASLLDRMPAPTGWRILILPYRGKEKTSGGILLPDEVQEKSQDRKSVV